MSDKHVYVLYYTGISGISDYRSLESIGRAWDKFHLEEFGPLFFLQKGKHSLECVDCEDKVKKMTKEELEAILKKHVDENYVTDK